MGNPDVVYIFNSVVAVLVKGEQYQNNGKTPLSVAIEIYNQKAKENIDYYYNGIKSGLTPTDENYKPEDDWEIIKISRCEPINF